MFKTIKNIILMCFLTLATVNIASADDRKLKLIKNNDISIIEIDDQFRQGSVDIWLDDIDAAVEAGNKIITLELNSGGGNIFAGNKLLHAIIKYQKQGIKFHGIVKEYCMSMCFVTLQFLDKRFAYPFAILLDHPASGGANKAALVQIEELLKEVITSRMMKAGKSALEIKLYQLLYSSEFYFNTRLGIELGLLDGITMPGGKIKNEPKPVKKSTK